MASAGVVPDFGDNGHLPCGRYRVDMGTAYDLLVVADRFAESQTRSDLWDNLTAYLLRFESLQDQYPEETSGRPIVRMLWMAGSFVSAKVDPSDIDLTVFTDAKVVEALKGKPGVKWIADAFQRANMLNRFGLDPQQVDYVPVPHVFRPQDMTNAETGYFRDRGRFDDWWQRLHPPGTLGKQEPTIDSCVPARGYLEVTL